MFDKTIRDLALAGTVALSTLGIGKASAQEKVEVDATPQPAAATVVVQKEASPLAEVSMPAIAGAAKLEQMKIPSTLNYIPESMRGMAADALVVMLGAGACAIGGAAVGIAGTNALRPWPAKVDGKYDYEGQRSFDQIVQAVTIGTAIGAGVLGGGYIAHDQSQMKEISINTTISSVEDSQALLGNSFSIRIPDIDTKLEIRDRELFNTLRQGDPIKINFVVNSDGNTLTGWYLSPLSNAHL